MSSKKQAAISQDSMKQDTKDFLAASGRLLTGVLRRGLCSARAAGNRWRNFAESLSQSFELLKKPPFISGNDAPRPNLDPLAEPVVTVVESADRRFPLGTRMPLSQADELVRRLDEEEQSAGREPQTLRVVIDYTINGLPDRYQAELSLGDGDGSLVQQIKAHVDAYRRDAARTARLLEGFPPEVRRAHVAGLQEDMDRTANQLVGFFQSHCDISRMESGFAAHAQALPESARGQYETAARKAIQGLRRDVNLTAVPLIRVSSPRTQERKGSLRHRLEGYKAAAKDGPAGKERPVQGRER